MILLACSNATEIQRISVALFLLSALLGRFDFEVPV